MEAQCNFCASCLTEDSGGSWWTTGQGDNSVWCQMCWERESAKGWWQMIGELSELGLLTD